MVDAEGKDKDVWTVSVVTRIKSVFDKFVIKVVLYVL